MFEDPGRESRQLNNLSGFGQPGRQSNSSDSVLHDFIYVREKTAEFEPSPDALSFCFCIDWEVKTL